jgi:hypothetical protein
MNSPSVHAGGDIWIDRNPTDNEEVKKMAKAPRVVVLPSYATRHYITRNAASNGVFQVLKELGT